MTVAVSTMIVNSLISNGAKRIGGALEASEEPYYLGKLNAMIESWSLDRKMCYQVLQESFALTVSVGTYTIGSGASFSTARPSQILKAFVRDSSSADSEVNIVSYDVYDSIVVKNVGPSYPKFLYYDQGFNASGYATINLSPSPLAGLTLYIDSAKQLQSFASVSTALLMPPGYQRAIESNFTIETAPGLKSVPPEILKIARESKALIMGLNLPESISQLDNAIVGVGSGSILSGP